MGNFQVAELALEGQLMTFGGKYGDGVRWIGEFRLSLELLNLSLMCETIVLHKIDEVLGTAFSTLRLTPGPTSAFIGPRRSCSIIPAHLQTAEHFRCFLLVAAGDDLSVPGPFTLRQRMTPLLQSLRRPLPFDVPVGAEPVRVLAYHCHG
jgi:hypothetical protein